MTTSLRCPWGKKVLKEVESVEIISLMDNSVDFLSTIHKAEVLPVQKWIRKRGEKEWIEKNFRFPIAEHGFSMLVKVFHKGKAYTVLFDTGVSSQGVVKNAKGMGLALSEVESIIISHGHADHFGGLIETVKTIDKQNLPIIVHEDMFKIRGKEEDETVRKYPDFPTENQIEPAKYVKTRQPYFLAENTIVVTGEIPRKTSFEKGYSKHRVLVKGSWQSDPWIWDDRALVINIKNKGLIIVAGCAHAGIINTIYHAQKIAGTETVYAVLGGFHLAGEEFEKRIKETIEALRLLNPKLIAPSHCTGWRAIHAIAEALPKAFVWNSVGNLYAL
jgi:7,8-dihydropterin-6-yl-methyl-4-(beta-D-ribofuranosyl)aminobenzene 5'-phosphate synthase